MSKSHPKKRLAAPSALRRLTNDDILSFYRSLAACQTTSLADKLRRVSNPMDIIQLDIDPLSYNSADVFRHDYLLINILSKYDAFDLGIDRERVALRKFRDAELRCVHINERLSKSNPMSYLASDVIHTSKLKLLSIIGEAPDIDDLVRRASFSHGASFALARKEGDPSFKYSLEYPDVTLNAINAIKPYLESPLWRKQIKGLRIVRGNRVTTVPKNSKTDRVIAIEPTLNMYAQKAVGSFFRDKLKRNGIDLNDQTINQKLALEGSKHDSLATIDLKAASDSISLELCAAILPPEWYFYLLELRSEEGLIDGEWHEYAKISSMGNGFTFELESLIFFIVISAIRDLYFPSVKDRHLSVYGDDIIVPKQMAHKVIDTLGYLGFDTNDDKTFVEGPFRESCGKHYFQGIDVTPFFIRKPISHISDLFLHCNNFLRWTGYDQRYEATRSILLKAIPESWRKPRIPDGYGDGALMGCITELKTRFVRVAPMGQCYKYKSKVLVYQRDEKQKDFGSYLYWLNANEEEPSSLSSLREESTRFMSLHDQSRGRYKVRYLYFPVLSVNRDVNPVG